MEWLFIGFLALMAYIVFIYVCGIAEGFYAEAVELWRSARKRRAKQAAE